MPDGRAPVEGGTVIQVIGPVCPDCGQVCLHPALMAVDCPKCAYGTTPLEKKACLDCNGSGRVVPTLTDEQIDGRECERCRGRDGATDAKSGVALHDFGRFDSYPCRYCGFKGAAPHDPIWERACVCMDCTGTGRVGGIENRWVCLEKYAVLRGGCGHSDIVADDATWREFLQCLKTRTKTTVFEDAEVYHGGIFDYAHDRPAHENLSLSLLPHL